MSISWSSPREAIGADQIDRVLILRTAQLREVDWAREELHRAYPDAAVGVLGTQLKALGAFDDCVHFEVAAKWLTPRSVRPLWQQLRTFSPDLVVLCLNNSWRVGYQRASLVVKRLKAPHCIVAGYDHRWYRWSHADFIERQSLFHRAIDASVILLYPMVAAYLLAKPSRPLYVETPSAAPRRETRP